VFSNALIELIGICTTILMRILVRGRRVGEEQGVTGFVAYSFLFCFGFTFQLPCRWPTGDFPTASSSPPQPVLHESFNVGKISVKIR
jgi:hypothetical protein